MIPVRFSNKIVTDRDSFLLEMAKKDNCSSSSSILQSNTGLIKNVAMCFTKKMNFYYGFFYYPELHINILLSLNPK